jgi:hypothetical protein
MSDHTTAEEAPVRTYLLVWWIWVGSILNAAVGAFVALVVFVFGGTFLFLAAQISNTGMRITLMAVGLMIVGMALLVLVVAVCAIGFAVAQRLLSHLRTSADGIDFRGWPLHSLRCRWEDAERATYRRFLGISSDELLLRRAERSGPDWAWRFVVWVRRLLGMHGDPAIPLSSFQGWREGAIAQDLRKYAPHVFTADAELKLKSDDV